MADRVESLLAGFEGVSTPREAREGAEALVRTLVSLYGAGIERILAVVHDASATDSEEIFARLCEDKFVESLLCLHGLHPIPLDVRVQRALDSVRPYLKSHEGGIEVVSIEGDVVTLRLQGSCDGCPSSAATVKLAVERAILEQVPEIRVVEAEGVTAGATGHAPSLRVESQWIALESLAELATDGLATRDVSGTRVVFVGFDDLIYAYRSRCPACTSPLDGATIAHRLLTCPGCGASYDVVRAGRASDGGRAFVEPFPIVRENGRIRVAIPVGG